MTTRRHLFTRLLPGFLLLLCALAAFAALVMAGKSANTLYVAPGGSDGDGTSLCLDPAAPCATLRHALGRSAAGDAIRLAPGTYAEAGLLIPHALALIGDGAAAVTLDGGGRATVLAVAPGAAASVEGLTIRNGRGERGGAIRVEAGGTLALRRVALEGNRADWGGGVYVAGGGATVEDSRLAGNSAGAGGAIYVESGALSLARSEVAGNSAAAGGGLSLGPGATAALDRVTLAGNTANTVGGAIHSVGTLAAANTVLRDNRAAVRGGGLFNDGGAAEFDYTTWLGNTAPTGGALGGAAGTRLSASVLSGDRLCDGPPAGGGNLIDDASCGQPPRPATGLLADGRLTFGSNALDGAPSGVCAAGAATLTADARGEPRPADGDRDGSARCDIGAFEFQPRLTVIHNPTLADGTRFAFSGDLGDFALLAVERPRQIFEAPPGSYRLEQGREPGWKLTAITCDGDADGGSLLDAAGRTATIDLDPGERVACAFTIRPGRETVGVAVRAPAGPDPAVTFSGGLGAFELRPATQPDMRSNRLPLGPQAIQAAPPPGWRVAAIACAGDRDAGTTTNPAAGLALVDLDSKETIGCTFTLAPFAAASLTLRNETAPAGAAGSSADAPFAYTGDLGLFSLRAVSAAARTFSVPPGVYRVHELLHPLWALSRLDCAGDADGGSVLIPEEATAQIDLDAGEAVTCTFSHARASSEAGTITLVQAADPADGTPFAYSGAMGEFALSLPAAPSRTFAELPPGSYSVRQTLPAGWALDGITCAGDTDNGTTLLPDEATAQIDLDAGEVVTCTFANSRPNAAGAITVIHEADPADETQFRYTGAFGGFNLRAPSRPSRSYVNLSPGAYVVNVRSLDGWTLNEIACEGDTDAGSAVDLAASGVTIDLDAGEAILCRFRHTGPGVTPQPTPTPSPSPSPTPPPTATPTANVYLPFVKP